MASRNPLKMYVRARLATLRISIAEAERRGGLSRGFIGDIMRGQKRSVSGTFLTGLARALEVDPQQIIAASAGEGDASLSAASGTPEVDLQHLPALLALMEEQEERDVRVAAASSEELPVRYWWSIPEARLAEIGSPLTETVLVRVSDDSMAPDLMRTDSVLVDLTKRTLDAGLWIVEAGAAPLIRRVTLVVESSRQYVLLRAANPHFQEQRFPAGRVTPLGRVVSRMTMF